MPGMIRSCVCPRDVEAGFHKLYGKDFKTVVLHNVIDEDEILCRAAEPAEWETEPKKSDCWQSAV